MYHDPDPHFQRLAERVQYCSQGFVQVKRLERMWKLPLELSPKAVLR